MNKVKRYAARQILHSLGVIMFHVRHELWRVANVEADGLTSVEFKAVQEAIADIEAATDMLRWLGEEMRK